jgi:hypothetical protein
MIDHAQVIYKRFSERKTYQQIGNALGVSREYVRQILVDKHDLVTRLSRFEFEGIERAFQTTKSQSRKLHFKITPSDCSKHGPRVYKLHCYDNNFGLRAYCQQCRNEHFPIWNAKKKGINLQFIAEQLSLGP